MRQVVIKLLDTVINGNPKSCDAILLDTDETRNEFLEFAFNDVQLTLI